MILLYWIWDNIFDIALVMVGGTAFMTYLLQVKNEKKTAAALIIEQINSVENIIEDLKNIYLHQDKSLDDNSVYLSREIIYDGAWSLYKHLIIKSLSNSEFELLQKFFNSAYQIEKTKSDIVYCFKLSWSDKSFVTHWMNGKYNDPTYECPEYPDGSRKHPAILISQFYDANKNSSGFKAQIAYSGLYAELDNYKSLTGTTAYNKLLKLAGRR